MSNLYVPQLVAPSFALWWGVAFASPLVDLLTFMTVMAYRDHNFYRSSGQR